MDLGTPGQRKFKACVHTDSSSNVPAKIADPQLCDALVLEGNIKGIEKSINSGM